jgi:serine/threonine protein kinase
MAGGLEPAFARQLFGQLVSAVSFIHSKSIAHRDLKLENCFLDDDVALKVADFGLMKVFSGANGNLLSTICGTPNYMAGEIYDPTYQAPPVDVFAMGAILFLMRYG